MASCFTRAVAAMREGEQTGGGRQELQATQESLGRGRCVHHHCETRPVGSFHSGLRIQTVVKPWTLHHQKVANLGWGSARRPWVRPQTPHPQSLTWKSVGCLSLK